MIKQSMAFGVGLAIALSGCTKGKGHDKVLAGPMLSLKMQREDLKRVAPQPDGEAQTESPTEKPAKKVSKAAKVKARHIAKAAKQARRASAKKGERRPASVEKAKHRKQMKAARKARRSAKKAHRQTAHHGEDHSAVAAASDTVKD